MCDSGHYELPKDGLWRRRRNRLGLLRWVCHACAMERTETARGLTKWSLTKLHERWGDVRCWGSKVGRWYDVRCGEIGWQGLGRRIKVWNRDTAETCIVSRGIDMRGIDGRGTDN